MSPSFFLAHDHQQLQALALLYYVKSGVIALYGLCPIACVFLLLHAIHSGDTTSVLARELMRFGYAAVVLCLCLWLLTVALAACAWLAGRNLATFRGYRLCIGAALASCLFFPLGTLLGLLSLGVLARPSIRAKFVSHDHV